MNASFLRTAVILLAMVLVSSGVEPTQTKLITRVYRAWASELLMGANPQPSGDAIGWNVKKLTGARDGEARYDVWDFLTYQGLATSPGNAAILLVKSDAVVVTASAEQQKKAEKFFSDMIGIRQIESTVWLLEYDDDPIETDGRPPRSLAEIRERAGDSLLFLDSFKILSKSQQRGCATNKGGAGKASAIRNLLAFLGCARGSKCEIEGTIGPDGSLVDIEFRYEGRFKLSKSGADSELKFENTMTVEPGHQLVPSSILVQDEAATAKGKIRRRSLVVGIRLVGVDGRTKEEREGDVRAKDAELIRKAAEVLGEAKR